ncbi:MAG: prepilin-type N-terminal cleavage/methylation domain-containing protein [Halanaerobiales bacterium]|nr:prepilin-type N-terminal cleavage/methylation domain-containing protein [Halanaerobiales bacterium]
MQNNDGFTLVETIVSLLLLSIIVMGFFNVYLSLEKYNKLTEQKRLSFQLCQALLVEIEKDELEVKEGEVVFKNQSLKELQLANISEYDFIDRLTIKFKPLIIEGERLKDLVITEFNIKWLEHDFDFHTIVKKGGSKNL